MNATRSPSTRTKIPNVKIETKSQLSRIPSAFGDSGATGANWAKKERSGTGCHSMNVPEGSYRGTRVRLPADVVRPFDVFVNGVGQREGADYRLDGRTLVFDRELKTEGKLGFWRWLSLWVGIAGTYRQNDSVDVAYRRAGKPVVASKLPLEPLS
jgi:hypothetical protein